MNDENIIPDKDEIDQRDEGERLLTFLDQMQFRLKILDETRKATNTYLARDFNIFNYIQPDENRISDIIADFLDPEGDHGQGSFFLDQFLNLKNIPKHSEIPPDSKVFVMREYATDKIANSQRRMDILVKFRSSSFLLGIENKPSAMDQNAQLTDYATHLREASHGDFLLVYLSGDGTGPSEESISKKYMCQLESELKFVILNYRNHLVDWLKSCRQNTEAEKVRWFIQDFIEYIEKNFSNYDESDKETAS